MGCAIGAGLWHLRLFSLDPGARTLSWPCVFSLAHRRPLCAAMIGCSSALSKKNSFSLSLSLSLSVALSISLSLVLYPASLCLYLPLLSHLISSIMFLLFPLLNVSRIYFILFSFSRFACVFYLSSSLVFSI